MDGLSRGEFVDWVWATATCRGTSHLKNGSECQDASRCISTREALIAVVCDGAGSTTQGRLGAVITCRTISEGARIHFGTSEALPSDEQTWTWVDEARERINRAASTKSLGRREFATTLVSIFATKADTMVLHIGDGAAVVRRAGMWLIPSWPAQGEYAAQTFFITDDPAPQLRITRLNCSVDGAALFSDGLERLVLDFTKRSVPAPFFDTMVKPLAASNVLGRDIRLSIALKHYLDSGPINERTDDDKSLILAIRR